MQVQKNCTKYWSRNKFPDSHRVDRQLALIFESQGDLKNAVEGYEALVEEDPLDLISRKRQINIILNNICMSSENGTNGGETGNERAISTLVDHLSQFQADHESWMVLANLYCNEWKLSNAAYCLEEVILHMPDNRHIICRYAEIQYSGNPDQQRIRSARQYFIYANRLCPKWIRPLFGILVCCSRLRRTETQSDNISVFAWAKLQLKSLCQPCKLSVCVDKFIKSIEY
ncbi:hypothetical protein GJ496_003212 [Pomphorhynchus laevis]|nr:hypothetical protein GJ496_003212 [Pomphorhynchus laevis]